MAEKHKILRRRRGAVTPIFLLVANNLTIWGVTVPHRFLPGTSGSLGYLHLLHPENAIAIATASYLLIARKDWP